ncbi:MAG: aminotransferase class IV [Gammaproteobacteria bacterium]
MSTSLPHVRSASDPRFGDGAAFVDGEFVPFGEARIPIADMGFTRSDCTYDVVAVWHGAFFRLEDHLDRFAASCERGRFEPPLSRAAMREALLNCVRLSGLRDAYVEMLVTRGVPAPGERDPRQVANRFYAFAIPYVWIARPEQQDDGVSLVVAREATRTPPEAVDPRMKNFQWGDLVRGQFEAFERDAHTAVLLNAAGNVTEGPGFNVFALVDGELLTPADGVLEGITRRTVLELSRRAGIAARCADLGAAALTRATEVFLTSTAGGIMPVTMLDGLPVGDGRPGAVTLRLRQAYWDAHGEPGWTTPVDYS